MELGEAIEALLKYSLAAGVDLVVPPLICPAAAPQELGLVKV